VNVLEAGWFWKDVVSVVSREGTHAAMTFLLLCEVAVLVDQHGGWVCQERSLSS